MEIYLKATICLPVQVKPKMCDQYLGWEDPLEEEMATRFSILTWKTPWTEEFGGLQPMESQRVWHLSLHTYTIRKSNMPAIMLSLPACPSPYSWKLPPGSPLTACLEYYFPFICLPHLPISFKSVGKYHALRESFSDLIGKITPFYTHCFLKS